MEKPMFEIDIRNWMGERIQNEGTAFRAANLSEAMGEALAILAPHADEDLTVVAFGSQIKYTRKGEYRIAKVVKMK